MIETPPLQLGRFGDFSSPLAMGEETKNNQEFFSGFSVSEAEQGLGNTLKLEIIPHLLEPLFFLYPLFGSGLFFGVSRKMG